jgi:hypothetical protein
MKLNLYRNFIASNTKQYFVTPLTVKTEACEMINLCGNYLQDYVVSQPRRQLIFLCHENFKSQINLVFTKVNLNTTYIQNFFV